MQKQNEGGMVLLYAMLKAQSTSNWRSDSARNLTGIVPDATLTSAA